MSTLIDSLVVELGLNSKQFVDGMKGSADSIAGFATKVLGLAGVVTSVEGVFNYFKGLHAQLAEVGFAARNMGVAGTELSRFGEVAQLAGGHASDAVASVQDLQAAIFNLQYRGQISDGLAMLQRFGVAYLDARGHMRDFKAIALDAAAAVDRAIPADGTENTQGARKQLALSFEFPDGVAAAVAQGGKGLEAALAESQVDQKALTENSIRSQVKLDQTLTRLHFATTANSAAILNKLTPEIIKMVTGLHHLADEELPKVVHAIENIQDFFKNPPPWIKQIEDAFTHPPEWLKNTEKFLGPTGTLIAEFSALTFALGAGGALTKGILSLVGTMALLPLRAGAGVVAGTAGAAGAGIKAAAGAAGLLVADLVPATLIGLAVNELWNGTIGHVDLNSWTALINSLRTQDTDSQSGPTISPDRIGVIQRGATAPVTPSLPLLLPAPPTPTAARPSAGVSGSPTPTAMNGGAGTTVQIDSMTINTRATDAYAMASNMSDALNRKILVANADMGQV